jgi:hypothetical protein
MNLVKQPSGRARRAGALAAFLSASALLLSLLAGIGRADASEDEHEYKAGRVMLNARGGLAVGIANADHDLYLLGMVGLDLGVAVSSNYNAYIVLTPQLDLRDGLYNVMVPLGFQYDIRLFRGLFLYPRISLGYAAFISNASIDFGPLHFSASDVIHGGVAIPELGLKLVLSGRLNIGIEPLSVPIFFTDKNYAAWYRVNVFLGGNF